MEAKESNSYPLGLLCHDNESHIEVYRLPHSLLFKMKAIGMCSDRTATLTIKKNMPM